MDNLEKIFNKIDVDQKKKPSTTSTTNILNRAKGIEKSKNLEKVLLNFGRKNSILN